MKLLLMFSCFHFLWFNDIEVLCFIFTVEKDKDKVLKLNMMHFSCFEKSVTLFQAPPLGVLLKMFYSFGNFQNFFLA